MRSIRTQLIVVFLVVILVPSGVLACLMYTRSLSLIDTNLGDAQVNKLLKATALIDQSLSDMSLLLNQLAANESFVAAVAGIKPGSDSREAVRVSALMRNAQSFYNSRIEKLYLYLYEPREIITAYANQRIVEIRDEAYYDWISKYRLGEGAVEISPWFLSRGVPSPSVSESIGRIIVKKRLIRNRDGAPLGELGMIISGSTLRSAYLESIRSFDREILLMLDEECNPIATIGMDVAQLRSLSGQAFLTGLDARDAQGRFRTSAFGVDSQVCFSRSRQSGFIYMSVIPVSQYTDGMVAAGLQGLLVAILAAVFAVFVSVWYSMQLSRPIRMLKDAMQRAGSGDLNVRADYNRRDEFSEMTDGFNNMIQRIEQLMRNLENEELLLKEAELRNLLAQVNPHFLYNALETIHWMARTNHAREAAELCMSLANFYRATLSEGRKTVTVRESLDMIREYIAILTARYEGRFSVRYDVPAELEDEQVLHLVLQPLVENVIQHSIERVAYHVNLFIGIEARGDDILMTVYDDGAGMDGATLERVRASLDDDSARPEGFALKNVHKRIRLLYGEGYGLTVESVPGGYTKVRARMRKLPRQDFPDAAQAPSASSERGMLHVQLDDRG